MKMADNNKNTSDSRASDNVKASGLRTDENNTKARKSFASGEGKAKSAGGKKRGNEKMKLIFTDVGVFLIIAVLIAGISMGIAAAVRYYSTEYSDVTVSYQLLIEKADPNATLDIQNGTAVYARAEDGSSVRIGSVSDCERINDQNGTVSLIVTVSAEAEFNPELGYFVHDVRIATGARIDCRFSGFTAVCPVIRLE